jgi:cytoskeletal protein RodZ
MKTAGSILRQSRIEKKISLETVEQATKIRKKFLEAIESDDFAKLPSLSYAKGFVKNYGDYLGLDSDNVLAFFRRQNADVTRSSLLPKGMAEPLNRSIFHLTPTRFIVVFIGFLIIMFLLYFGFQYVKLQTPPSLNVIEPTSQSIHTTEKRLNVMGETDPDATVMINGVGALVRSDGKFFDSVTLSPGNNVITIISTSRFGKTQTVIRSVLLE